MIKNTIALEAIKQRHTIYFTTAHELVETLQQAHQNNTIRQKIKVFTKPNLFIIDEIGYRKMEDAAAHFFFQIVSERYETGSIILTSNKSYGAWGEIFGDSVLATAILDRLLHHSTTINIKGKVTASRRRRKPAFSVRKEQRGSKTEC